MMKQVQLGTIIQNTELINALLDKQIQVLTKGVDTEKSPQKKDDLNKKLNFVKESKKIYTEQAVNTSKLATKWLEMQRGKQEEKDHTFNVEMKKKRVDKAADYMDKEIKKIIAHLKRNGSPPDYELTFGKLFKFAEDDMDALSGILRIAKKAGAVSFDSEHDPLMQGRDDKVIIKLINENFTPTEKKYTEVREVKKEALVMETEKLSELKLGEVTQKCNLCQKIVLPQEEVSGISIMGSIVLHQDCFKCHYCQSKLSSGSFSELDGKYYCVPHYKSLFMKNTSYNFK